MWPIDVGVGLEHHVRVDEARAGDRRPAGVDRALDAVLARPGDHLPSPSAPSLTPPSPTSPRSVTPAAASSLEIAASTMPGSITGAPAWTLTPPGRKAVKARCAMIAIALTPTTSRGRPGVCTSPAEIIVVTPPCRKESIQPSWSGAASSRRRPDGRGCRSARARAPSPARRRSSSRPRVDILAPRPTAAMRPSRATSCRRRGSDRRDRP